MSNDIYVLIDEGGSSIAMDATFKELESTLESDCYTAAFRIHNNQIQQLGCSNKKNEIYTWKDIPRMSISAKDSED